MKKPIVINLFGPPGSGKSTGAAYIFSELKQRGINAELVTEFAKDKTWEGNTLALSCQEYVFGKQSYRLARCREDVDVIVTDSPLPLSLIYNNNPILGEKFNDVVLNVFHTYNNFNYYVERVKPYNPKGRSQTEEESNALGKSIKDMLNSRGIFYQNIKGKKEDYQQIVDAIEWRIKPYFDLQRTSPLKIVYEGETKLDIPQDDGEYTITVIKKWDDLTEEERNTIKEVIKEFRLK